MKTISGILIFLLTLSSLRAQTTNLTTLLQQGLFEEQANRNLDAAIADYQTLALQFDKDRQLAATAIFRLGECYRAQGKTNEAVGEYQRILRDFSDQQTLANLSKEDLTGMGLSPTGEEKNSQLALGRQGNAASSEAATLSIQITGIEKLKSDPEEQARAALAIFPDEQLRTRLLSLPNIRDHVAKAKADPQYQPFAGLHRTNFLADEERILTNTILGIQHSVDFIMDLQKARLKALQEGSAGRAQGETQQSPAITNDEDQEIEHYRQMLKNSPDLINASNGGSSPLCRAANAGELRVAAFLLDHGANINAVSGGETPLDSAAMNGQKSMVELLLSRGADVNGPSPAGGTALLTSTWNDYQAVVEVLLAHKADVNARLSQANGRNTPLHVAVTKGFANLIKLFLANGADVHAANSDGDTPLHLAARNKQIEIVRMLLAAGADVNVENNQGRTPLSYAADADSLEEVKLLLQFKANPNVRSSNGKTPLDELKVQTNVSPEEKASIDKIIDLLHQHGALDKLPEWDSIQVSRPSANLSFTVFRKGTNDWNQFTLLQAILDFYELSRSENVYEGQMYRPGGMGEGVKVVGFESHRLFGNQRVIVIRPKSELPFPDLTRLVVVRPTRDSTNETRTAVNLLNGTNGIDCSKDVSLQFGDVVEIPEHDHALGDSPVGLSDYQRDALFDCLNGNVQLIVHDKKVELPLLPIDGGHPTIGAMLKRTEAQQLLLASSDLSRVKVIRQGHEWTLDCEAPSSPDFWLRNGDVIEVPEKP